MICVGSFLEAQMRMEEMVESHFPRRLSMPDVVNIANEYEMMLSSK